MKKFAICLLFLAAVPLLGSGSNLSTFPNIGVIQIQHPEAFDRVFAISDVHGMLSHLTTLLTANHIIDQNGNWAAGESLLIVVGDSVDKGPDSLGVLGLWARLMQQSPQVGGQVIHLLGNHEAEFLANPNGDKIAEFREELQQKNLFNNALDPKTSLGSFLRSMPLAARVGNWLFCHAGFYPQMDWPDFVNQSHQILSSGDYAQSFITGPTSILEAKDWWANSDAVANLESRLASNHFYGVVFGHQPKALGVDNDIAALDSLKIIKIDSGMAPAKEGGRAYPGHLLFFPRASDLNLMAAPQALSLGVNGSHPL